MPPAPDDDARWPWLILAPRREGLAAIGWRAMFLLSVLPALLVLFIRSGRS